MPNKVMKRILVTGATGVGVHRRPPSEDLKESGPLETVDVTRRETIEKVVEEYDIDTIYHMAAILSAAGEKNPWRAWDVNITGEHGM